MAATVVLRGKLARESYERRKFHQDSILLSGSREVPFQILALASGVYMHSRSCFFLGLESSCWLR